MNLKFFNSLLAQAPETGGSGATTSASASATVSADEAHKFYVSILGRSADNTGLDYWTKTSGASGDLALSSFLLSREAASDNAFLNSLQNASVNNLARVASDQRSIEDFVGYVLKNIGGDRLASKSNVDRYTSNIRDALDSASGVTKENLDDTKNDLFNKLTAVVKTIIGGNSSNEIFANRVAFSKSTVDLLRSFEATFPNVAGSDGKLLLTEELVNITSGITGSKISLTRAVADVTKAFAGNPFLKSDFDINEFLKKQREAGQKGAQSLIGSDADDRFLVAPDFSSGSGGQRDEAWLGSVDAGKGKDTLTIETNLSGDVAKVFENFESIVFKGSSASAELDLNAYSAGNEGAAFVISGNTGNSSVVALKSGDTDLTYEGHSNAGSSKLTISADGDEARVSLTVNRNLKDLDVSKARKLDISGGSGNAVISVLDFKGTESAGKGDAEASFSGSRNIKVGEVKGVGSIEAGRLTGNLDITAKSSENKGIANGVVITGGGDDKVNLEIENGADGSNLIIFSGDGSDDLKLSLAKDNYKANISSGSGNDKVDVKVTSASTEVRLDTGDGNDVIDLSIDKDDSSANISSGRGDDDIKVVVKSAKAKVRIDAGDGNDIITINVEEPSSEGNVGSAKLSEISINGGAGKDTFVIGKGIKARKIEDISKLNDNFTLVISDYEKGERILLHKDLDAVFDIKNAQSYINGSDTYVTIAVKRSEESDASNEVKGLVIKLAGYSESVPIGNIGLDNA